MASLRRIRGDAIEAIQGFRSKNALSSLQDIAKRLATPKALEKKVDAATRVGQILALFFLGPVILVSLALIVALNDVMSGVFGLSDYGESQGGIIGWLITAITGGAFLLAAYAWFQFVRTAGFGWFNTD